MIKERRRIRLRASHILVILFLGYIFYVGASTLPQFLNHTKESAQEQGGLRGYIRQTNDLYSDMLKTGSEYALLLDKGTYINLNGLMANALGQPMMNNRVTLKNGHLTEIASEAPDPDQIHLAAENIIRFHDTHIASGGNFLFVMAPSQISKYEDLLPAGYTDTTNATADAFLALLEAAGVPCLDLREEMNKENLSVTDTYFVTDHHWTPQTGFWAYGKILDKLARMQAITPVDSFYTNPENYTFETVSHSFLGSSGRRTGRYYAGLDEFTLIRPNFETDIQVRIPARELELRGPYEEVCCNTVHGYDFQNPDFFNENYYALYGWSDTKITHWRNEQAPEQGKFLLIGESFGNIPFSLMSICFGSCDELDMRHYDGDFAAHYAQFDPDTVIMEVNAGMTVSENTTYPFCG